MTGRIEKNLVDNLHTHVNVINYETEARDSAQKKSWIDAS